MKGRFLLANITQVPFALLEFFLTQTHSNSLRLSRLAPLPAPVRQELGVSVVLYDPMTPHGLLVAEKLKIPKVRCVTPSVAVLGLGRTH